MSLHHPGYRRFLLISYGLWGAVTLRWLTEFIEVGHAFTWAVGATLLLFGVLLGVGPYVVQGRPPLIHLYLAVQTALVFAASLFHFELDFFALLYVPLAGQAMFLLPRRAGRAWLVVLIAVTVVGQLIQFGGPAALSFSLFYAAAIVFTAAFVNMMITADDSRRRSEQLLADLQEAHRQLQRYADQAEALAVADERTRLARDLHDSVAQTLYGLTLQAEAADRRLDAGRYDAVHRHLQEIRADAQQTLQETRLLIFELRPPILEQSGLAAALRARLEAVETRSGVAMHLDLQEVDGLPAPVETALYRIAQEALNNTAKYAGATELRVRLARSAEAVTLEIADNGAGFDPQAVAPGSAGLLGMRERAAQVNAALTVRSAPGAGTAVLVEVPL